MFGKVKQAKAKLAKTMLYDSGSVVYNTKTPNIDRRIAAAYPIDLRKAGAIRQ